MIRLPFLAAALATALPSETAQFAAAYDSFCSCVIKEAERLALLNMKTTEKYQTLSKSCLKERESALDAKINMRKFESQDNAEMRAKYFEHDIRVIDDVYTRMMTKIVDTRPPLQ